ncbi:hypothetical protein [uncultured Roseovarius sp.]|uniref:hypothetical protein n=1 Tax=uncultured Roseovarius sp. TaxID=293344 RepID=UPI0025EC4310|nr:hypothetical protein [uncultured Roseovarius sp.]
MSLRKLHRWNAGLLGAFLLFHLGNHLVILGGIDAHLAVMEGLRGIYRILPLELAIFALFFIQILLGLIMVWRGGKPQSGWAWAQVLSGTYLAFFLLQHLGAILVTRAMYPELSTNSYWAASVVSRAPAVFYFAPYYFLAWLALFTHIACALRFRAFDRPARPWHFALPGLGGLLGLAVVAGLMASFADLPPAYVDYVDGLFFGGGSGRMSSGGSPHVLR